MHAAPELVYIGLYAGYVLTIVDIIIISHSCYFVSVHNSTIASST